MLGFVPSLGVVPILVNVATPLLPAVLAGLAGALSLLARPRELLRLFSRRPRPFLAVAGVVGIGFGVWCVTARTATAARAETDWAAVAREILEQRAAGTGELTFASTGKLNRREFGGSRYDGGVAPERLAPAWSFKKEATMFLSSPAIAGDRIFGASALLDVGGGYGSIFCLDARTGERLWEVEQIDGRDVKAIYSSPVLSEDARSVIVGEGLHFDENCALICLDAATGQLRWRTPTPLHLESSPAVFGDRVIVGAGAIEPPGHAPARKDGFVLCVRISDGVELWRHPVIDPESSPAIAEDGTVFIGSGIGGNAIVALRSEPDAELLDQSRLVWQTPAPYPVTGPITIAGNLILAAAGRGDLVRRSSEPAGAVLALDRQTGRVVWQTELDDAVLGGLAAGDGLAICPVRNGELVALDLRDGRVVWRQRFAGNAPLLSSPVLAGGRVYAVSGDGVLAVLEARDGRIIEKHLLNSAESPGRQALSLSSPLVAGGRVFVGSETGGLRCFATRQP